MNVLLRMLLFFFQDADRYHSDHKSFFNCLFFVCNTISHKRGECAQILFTKESCDDLGHKDTCNLNKSICKRNDLTNVSSGFKFCENKSEHLEYIKKQIRPTFVVTPGRGELSHNYKAQRHLQLKQIYLQQE